MPDVRKPKTTIGVSQYTIFPVDKDASTGTTYLDAIPVPGTVEIAPTDSGNAENFDADDEPYEVDSYIESMGHELTNADIPPDVEAVIRGLDLKDNGVEYDKDTPGKAPYCGVAWKVRKSDGHFRLVRYYKGKYAFASNVGGQTRPSQGAPEHQTATSTYAAVPRDSDGKIYYYLDTDNLPEGVSEAEAIENWFTDMNWYPSTEVGA